MDETQLLTDTDFEMDLDDADEIANIDLGSDEDESIDEENSVDVVTQTTIVSSKAIISRPKQFVHIQSAHYVDIDLIPTVDQADEELVPSTQKEDGCEPSSKPKENEVSGEGALSDNLSGDQYAGTAGVGMKEAKQGEASYGLDGFKKAIFEMNKLLEGSIINWEVVESPLESQKSAKCGSRWFLEMDNDQARLWCCVQVQYKGTSFYFIEVGRSGQDDKLSISTLCATNQPLDPFTTIAEMIDNNGHWQKSLLGDDILYLPHRHMGNSEVWGKYLAEKIVGN